MKSITIHGIDEKLDKLLKQRAKRKNQSINKTARSLLEKSVGVNIDIENERRKEFLDLFGIWSKNDFTEFEKNSKEFEQIDKRDWQ